MSDEHPPLPIPTILLWTIALCANTFTLAISAAIVIYAFNETLEAIRYTVQ